MRKTDCGGHTPIQFKLLVFSGVLLFFGGSFSFLTGAWIAGSIFAAAFGCVLSIVCLKLSEMSLMRRNIDVLEKIKDGRAGGGLRVEAGSDCDAAGLATAFNGLLDAFERKEAEKKKLIDEVEKSKHEWETMFDAIADPISIHDAGCRALKVNRALAGKLNVRPQDLIGKRCFEIYYNRTSHQDACMLARDIESGGVGHLEVDDMVFEGTYRVTAFPVKDSSGAVRGCVHIARDITQEKLMRDHLLQSEKLATVGKLVAGIAHELNNPLMGVMGFSQILMDSPGDKKLSDVKDKLGKIYNESSRIASIVQNLVAFARTKKTERDYQSINGIIKKALALREYSLRANNIEVALDLEADLPNTMVDVLQMQQIFINLITNAEDAIVGAKKEGRITITTKRVRRKIEMTVRDNGPGIPRDIINKIFDPFFTTKAVGRGTGMGLSTVHGIITEHGGGISISEPPEGGTLVVMELPVMDREDWNEVKKAVETARQ